MAEHPIQGLMSTAMENLKEMVDVNTIVGDPVETPDGSVILPVSKVGFGFAAGGSEFDPEVEAGKKDKADVELPFGGGAGGGVSITPIGFLVVGNGQVKMLSTEGPNQMYEKLIELAPQMVDKISQMMKKNAKQQNGQQQQQGASGSNGNGGSAGMRKSEGKGQQQQYDC